MAVRGFTLIFLIVVNFSPGNAGKCVCIEPIMSGSNRASLIVTVGAVPSLLGKGVYLEKTIVHALCCLLKYSSFCIEPFECLEFFCCCF